jgi:predicted transcriptional regulator
MMLFAGAGKDGRAMRDRIRAEVAREPGIHVSELAQRIGVSWHTTAYHLGVLAKSRSVLLEKGGRERRVFPAGMPSHHRRWLVALRSEEAAEVLRLLLKDPRQSVPVLSRRMGFSEKIVRRQVARLAEAGLVDRLGELRPVYEPAPQARMAEAMGLGLERRRSGDQGALPLDEDD